jgi:hypothetical protein
LPDTSAFAAVARAPKRLRPHRPARRVAKNSSPEATKGATPLEMAIVGNKPETGARYELRREEAGPPFRYEGRIALVDEDIQVRATLLADGAVEVELPPSEPWRERVRLLLRTAVRQASAEGARPPRTLRRWRAEK